MAYASRAGRARTNPKNPSAFAVCDRCGIWTNRNRLTNQQEWKGTTLLPLYLFVCDHCLDVPQEQLRTIVLPADPTPVYQPRPEVFINDESNFAALSASTTDPTTGLPVPSPTTLGTGTGTAIVGLPFGRPDGLRLAAVMPVAPSGIAGGSLEAFGVPLKLLSVFANGTDQITVTTNGVHGLSTGDQIAVEGLSASEACGFFSVVVGASATMFTYQTYTIVPVGALLTGSTLMVTASVGLPRGVPNIPQVGP